MALPLTSDCIVANLVEQYFVSQTKDIGDLE